MLIFLFASKMKVIFEFVIPTLNLQILDASNKQIIIFVDFGVYVPVRYGTFGLHCVSAFVLIDLANLKFPWRTGFFFS